MSFTQNLQSLRMHSKSDSSMSNHGEEYRTEFGEFLDFNADIKSDEQYQEGFQEWVPITEIDLTASPLFATISEAVANAKAQHQQGQK